MWFTSRNPTTCTYFLNRATWFHLSYHMNKVMHFQFLNSNFLLLKLFADLHFCCLHKAIYNWRFVHCHFAASNWNDWCGGYLDNFKILSILTLTFSSGFPCAVGLEKLQKMPQCNYILIKLPNFVFLVVWRFTLFCPMCGEAYQRSKIIFCHSGPFFALLPPYYGLRKSKLKKEKKMKKTPEGIITLQK